MDQKQTKNKYKDTENRQSLIVSEKEEYERIMGLTKDDKEYILQHILINETFKGVWKGRNFELTGDEKVKAMKVAFVKATSMGFTTPQMINKDVFVYSFSKEPQVIVSEKWMTNEAKKEGLSGYGGIKTGMDEEITLPNGVKVGGFYIELTAYKTGGDPAGYTARAYLNEYYNSYSPIWKDKPQTMLEKVCRAKIARLIAPDRLNNSYIKEEFVVDADVTDTSVKQVKQKKTKTKETKPAPENNKVVPEPESEKKPKVVDADFEEVDTAPAPEKKDEPMSASDMKDALDACSEADELTKLYDEFIDQLTDVKEAKLLGQCYYNNLTRLNNEKST